MGNDDAALQFGERLIALLDGGRFTATYKFAVLIARIDGLSTEVLAELVEAGEPTEGVAGDYGLAVDRLQQALAYERSPAVRRWRRAARTSTPSTSASYTQGT